MEPSRASISDVSTISSPISLSDSVRRTQSHRIDHLVEISHIPDDVRVEDSPQRPLINPYNIFKKGSITRSIKTLISSRRPVVKEYIQSSKLNQCTLGSSTAEQSVTIEIPSEFITQWIKQG